MASTVLPNGIIIPEKYSRDWYNDLYHNWQELDNLLAGGGAGGGANDGTLTIQKNGATVGTFSANQATDETVNISVPTATSELTNDSNFVASADLSAVATSGSYNDLSNKPTIPTKTSDLNNDSGFITEDTTKIPLAGSNAISGSLIPATDNSIDVGSSTKNLKMLYTKGITINGTQFLPSDYIPKAGGAVMTGSVLGRTVDSDVFSLWGGTNWNTGGEITLRGQNQDSLAGCITIHPAVSQMWNKYMTIYPDGTWIWDGTACQVTSDQRLKQQIAEIDDALLDAWEDVELSQFKYNDAVDQKGKDKARLHTGYVVQQIDKACKEHGVDISAYGLYCHEEYPEETAEIEVEQADGTKTKERKVVREASEHYSLRYTEALIVECKYLRRCIARLTARIEELEKGNNTK